MFVFFFHFIADILRVLTWRNSISHLDDPSVLRQAETEFASKRFHLHDESDKENVPKPAKQQKMCPDKAKVAKPKPKGKAGKKAKAKKVRQLCYLSFFIITCT